MSAPGTPETYDVVLLVEEALSAADAAQVVSLHEAVALPVRHHVLLPVEDAAARVQTYTKEHTGQCIALVASGKVVWHPQLASALSDNVFVLSGGFSAAEAAAIAQLFAPNP